MTSSTSIIFSTELAHSLLSLQENNIISMDSNICFTDADIPFAYRAKINRKLLEKSGRTIFVANFSTGSNYWDEEEDLKKDGVFLFDIDIELQEDNKKLQADITNFFDSINVSKSDIVYLGGVPVSLIQSIIKCIQNYNHLIRILKHLKGF